MVVAAVPKQISVLVCSYNFGLAPALSPIVFFEKYRIAIIAIIRLTILFWPMLK
jgi:hypothetical protein